MVHRHLYAHRTGLVNEAYISSLLSVSGEDIRPTLAASGYPSEEIYWFRPLKKLNQFIEDMRRFFRELP